jgi:hypothetical protein
VRERRVQAGVRVVGDHPRAQRREGRGRVGVVGHDEDLLDERSEGGADHVGGEGEGSSRRRRVAVRLQARLGHSQRFTGPRRSHGRSCGRQARRGSLAGGGSSTRRGAARRIGDCGGRRSESRCDATTRQARPLYRFAIALLKPFCVALWRREASGLQHLPRTGGGLILAANHISPLDPIAIADHVLHDLGLAPRFLAKSSLFGAGASSRPSCGAPARSRSTGRRRTPRRRWTPPWRRWPGGRRS